MQRKTASDGDKNTDRNTAEQNTAIQESTKGDSLEQKLKTFATSSSNKVTSKEANLQAFTADTSCPRT